MIAIPTNSLDFRRAFKAFKDAMSILIKKRLAKEINEAVPDSDVQKLLNIIQNHLEDILFSEPSRLIIISGRFNRFLTTVDAADEVIDTDCGKAIKKVFNYNWFIDKTTHRYSAYHMTEDLGINVCVYCNRTYTHTVIKKDKVKITRPTLDHYFNKARHPLLAVSFYNLIPSCSICNSSVKHESEFELITHYHPYLDDYINEFRFSYKPDQNMKSGLRILIKSTDIKTVKTLGELETVELYNTHAVELKGMLEMRYKFSDNYLKILEKYVLNGTKVSQKELYRIAFGTESEQADFGRAPFSKFKNDILKELGIVKN